MKIAFITSSLEPGRDGVGDYTLGFADELLQMGHEVMAVSLRDKHVGTAISVPKKGAIGSFQTVRIPSTLSWPKAIVFAKRELDHFRPNLVSIQFVTYTYHPRGFVNGLAGKLGPLLAGRNVHVMFHEVWRGAQKGAAMKERLIGMLQKRFILSLIKRLKPARIHPTNLAYQALLKRNGLDARILPLFGNVAINKNPGAWMDNQLAKMGVAAANRDKFCLLGIFGSIPPEWPMEDFLKTAGEAIAKTDRQLLLLTAGTHSAQAEERLQKSARNLSVKVASFGPQSQERLSEFLQNIDYGVATTSWCLVGKSGAVAAMLDHGLPVLVFRDDVDMNVSEPGGPQLIKMEGDWDRKMRNASRMTPRSRRPDIVRAFLRDLQIDSPEIPRTGHDGQRVLLCGDVSV